MKLVRITPSLGAEVEGLDLSKELSSAQIQALQTAFETHHVLVFRDQTLSREAHKAFASYFGPIHVHPSKRNLKQDEDPDIFFIDIKPESKQSNGETWHSDITCEAIPPYASMLYLTKVPENLGGDTLFANLQAAFEELSPDLQHYLMQQSAFHDGELDLMRYGIRLKPGQSYPAHAHPAVIQHPKTKKPVLYVNEGFTAHLLGVPAFESNLILQGLFQRIRTNARHQCRIKWTPNMITLWDNYSVQHQAIFDYSGYHRYGERITLASDQAPQAYTVAAPSQ
jgi:taurine dioxygenase